MAIDPAEAVKEAMMKKAREAMGGEVKVDDGTPPPPEPDDFVGVYAVDTKGKVKFSEALKKAGYKKVKVPKGADDPYITVYKTSDWDKEHQQDIPEPDLDYIWPWKQSVDLVLALEDGEKPVAVGDPGTGKTVWSKNYAAITNRPYLRFNMNGAIEPDSFLGKILVEDGSTVWKDGDFPKALRAGYMIDIDEWTKMVAPVSMALQWLFEDGGMLRLYDKPEDNLVKPHDRARIMLCDNTKGLGDNVDKFAATNIQDSSTLDRFGVCVEFDYLPQAAEIRLVKSWYPTMTDHMAKNLITFAALVRKGYRAGEITLSFSPRTIKKAARYTLYHSNPATGISKTFFRKLADDGEKSAVNALFTTVFGSKYGSLS